MPYKFKNDETLAFTKSKHSLNWHALVKSEVMSLVTLLKYDLGACLQPRSVAILKENTPLTSVICETILILMISSSISQRPAHFGQFCYFLLAEHPPLKDTFTGSSITTLKPHGRVLRAL